MSSVGGNGRLFGAGGGCSLGGHWHSLGVDFSGVAGVSMVVRVSPTVGNFSEMIPSDKQACLDRKSRFVWSEKYTSWWVIMVSPGGVTPLTCKGRAPIMLIPSLLAAFIFMLTGMRWDLFRPIL